MRVEFGGGEGVQSFQCPFLTDQSWHDDSLGVKDTYSSLLPLMHREFDLQREDGGVHTMSMSVGNDAEGSIFETAA